MDPGSILGAAVSVTTVVQMCTESLNWLLQLQNKYKNVDITVQLLITQLSTLRTALSQISEWVASGVHDVPPHIQTDLATSLGGCGLLIETLNSHLSRLDYEESKSLSMRKKARVLWGEKERADFQTLLGHNIAALQLLLTAMQCRSQSEQTILLQKASNRDIIAKARDETSSLLFLRDDESHDTRRSICTENSELLDSSFVFDREVLGSRAYLAAMKSNMKRIVREAHSKTLAKNLSCNGFQEAFQSEEDDQTITGDTEEPQNPTRLESTVSEPQSFGLSPSDLSTHADSNSIPDSRASSSPEAAHLTLSRQGSSFSETKKSSRRTLNQESRRLLRMPSLLKPRGSVSSQASLDTEPDTPCSMIGDEEELLLIGNAKSCAATLLSSLELAYGASHGRMTSGDDGIQETLITRKSAGVRYNYRIYNVVGLHSKENRWIYSFDKMSTLIFVVDISAYNLPASDELPSSYVQEDVAFFQQICSSKWLARTPILLLLSNTDILASKLQDFPLADHFPDYVGGPNDLKAVKSFFRQKFLCMNQKYGMRIWTVFIDSVATAKLGKVIVAKVEMILTEGKILAFGAR